MLRTGHQEAFLTQEVLKRKGGLCEGLYFSEQLL